MDTLRACMGQLIEELDLTDDRLADVLRTLADDTHWAGFERVLGQELLRVYDLSPPCVRVDMTTVSQAGQVTAEGLFQFGYSKDRRPDAPQVKVGLATLDPLGLPLARLIVPGNRADDPLYVPLIKQARAVVGRRGVLYVGDCKMGALATRATVEDGYNYDLCPLAATQVPPETLDHDLAEARAAGPPKRIAWAEADGTVAHLADSYERAEACATVIEGWMDVRWTERRPLIRSIIRAQAAEMALRARVVRTHQAIADLTVARRGKQRIDTVEAARAAATAVLTRYDVGGGQVTITADIQAHAVRAYADRPAQVRQTRTIQVHATVDTAALEAVVARLGWRVYATNAPAATLSATQSVLAYRQEEPDPEGERPLPEPVVAVDTLPAQSQDTPRADAPPVPVVPPAPWTSWEEVRQVWEALKEQRGLLLRRPDHLNSRQQAQVEALLASPVGPTLTVARDFLTDWYTLYRDC